MPLITLPRMRWWYTSYVLDCIDNGNEHRIEGWLAAAYRHIASRSGQHGF